MKISTIPEKYKPNRIFVALLILAGCLCLFPVSTASAEDEIPAEDIALKWFLFHAERGDASAQNNLGLHYEGKGNNEAEAMKWFSKAAEQGYVDAQNNLGVMYARKKNVPEAMKWYLKAAEQGLPSAQCNLGYCYADMNNFAEAVKWFRLASDRGDDTAQCNLGVCYRNGTGVERNPQEAFKLFRKAAERRNGMAEYNLGLCYINGAGTEPNEQEGLKYLNKALAHGNEYAKIALNDLKAARIDNIKLCRKEAEKSDANAQFKLAMSYAKSDILLERQPQEALKWFRKAAEQGHLKSQLYLAFWRKDDFGAIDCKAEGLDGEVFDAVQWAILRSSGDSIKEAAGWMRRAAEQGHKVAQYKLGVACTIGFNQNIEEGVMWFRKAAEQGHPEAQFTLGKYYQGGLSKIEGIEEDRDEAFKWFRKAAEQGHGEAQDKLSGCYLIGEGVAQNLEEAKKWNRKAMEQNATSMSIQDLGEAPPATPAKPKMNLNPTDPKDQYALAVLYDDGGNQYVSQSDNKATMWYLKSAEQGYADAQFKIAMRYYKGVNRELGDDRKPEEGVKWLRKAAEQGHPEAAYSLGVIYEDNHNITEAVNWYRKAAEKGHAEASYYLGDYYSNYKPSKLGVKPNYAEAIKWYRKADEQGYRGSVKERINYVQQLMAAQKK